MNLHGFSELETHIGCSEFSSLRESARAPNTFVFKHDYTGGASGGPDSSLSQKVITSGILPTPGSLDVTIPSDQELGMPTLSTEWGQVMRATELPCS
jgi:hypothetical protein